MKSGGKRSNKLKRYLPTPIGVELPGFIPEIQPFQGWAPIRSFRFILRISSGVNIPREFNPFGILL